LLTRTRRKRRRRSRRGEARPTNGLADWLGGVQQDYGSAQEGRRPWISLSWLEEETERESVGERRQRGGGCDGERGKGWIACGGCGGSNGLAAHIDGLCWRACMRGGLPARGGGSRPPPAGCVGLLLCGALPAFASFRYGFFLADCQILFVLGVCV
jgi:hypothetical protein